MRQTDNREGREAAAKVDFLNAFLSFQLDHTNYQVRRAARGLRKAPTRQDGIDDAAYAIALVTHQEKLKEKAQALLDLTTDPQTRAEGRQLLAKLETVEGLRSLAVDPGKVQAKAAVKGISRGPSGPFGAFGSRPESGSGEEAAAYASAGRIAMQFGRPVNDMKRLLDQEMKGGASVDKATGTVIDRIVKRQA